MRALIFGSAAVRRIAPQCRLSMHKRFDSSASMDAFAGTTGERYHYPKQAESGAPQGTLQVLPGQYPAVRRDASVVDVLHAVAVPDPYRWLEDPDAEATKNFVAAQNELTAGVLAQCTTRQQFKELFQSLYDYEKIGLPSKQGQRYYYSRNSGLQVIEHHKRRALLAQGIPPRRQGSHGREWPAGLSCTNPRCRRNPSCTLSLSWEGRAWC